MTTHSVNQIDQKKSDYIVLGRFGASHGVRGWIKLFSFTEPKSRLFADHNQFYISADEKQWRLIDVEAHRTQQDDFLVKLKEFDSPEAVRSLTHFYIGVPSNDLPLLSEGEYYWRDLVGLSVYNQNGGYLGRVDYLIETGANDVLVLDSKPPIAIPYLFNQFILSINLEAKRINVNWESD